VTGLGVRMAAVLFLRYALRLLAAWCFAWGLAVLLMRAVWGIASGPLLWGTAGLVPAAAVACVLALRRTPSRPALRAVLDRASGCGGLLMAGAEVPLGAWHDRLPAIGRPGLRWRSRPLIIVTVAACTFLVFSFAIPRRYVAISPHRPLNIQGEVAEFREQIEALREEQIIEPQQADELEEALARAAAEASAENPAETWEALDHLEDAVTKAAADPAEEALHQTEQLGKAESLARALAADADALKPEAMTAAMKKLAEMLDEAAAENEALREGGFQQALEGCKAGGLSAEAALELAGCLGLSKEAIAARLGRLVEARLIDAELLQMNELLGRCSGEGLAAFLAEAGGLGLPIEDLIEQWLVAAPGYGGIDRGRGDAPMTKMEPARSEGTDFTEQALPPATVADLKQSRLLGVSLGAPAVGTDAEPAAFGALKGTAVGGGSAHTYVPLPRHKRTVRRYFEREAATGADAPPSKPRTSP